MNQRLPNPVLPFLRSFGVLAGGLNPGVADSPKAKPPGLKSTYKPEPCFGHVSTARSRFSSLSKAQYGAQGDQVPQSL